MYLGTGTRKYLSPLFYLVLFSTIIRVLLAYTFELSNDEAYCRILALTPQLSYADHPPLLPYLINLVTSGSGEISELFTRLLSVIIGSVNTVLIYLIARKPIFRAKRETYSSSMLSTSDYRRGFLASVLYTASIYAGIVVGVFATPDTLLSLFWLLSINVLSSILPAGSRYSHTKMIIAGVFIGLAMLAKFTGIYLWIATILFALIYNHKLLKTWSLYFAIIVSAGILTPVILWNYEHDFIGFSLFTQRVFGLGNLDASNLFSESLGAILYNGVFNFLIFIGALISYFVGRIKFLTQPTMRFLMIFSIPLILTILAISVFQETMPHWGAPAYFALIIVGAAHLSDQSRKTMRFWQILTLGSTLITIALFILQLEFGLFYNNSQSSDELSETENYSLEMYGWDQLSDGFSALYNNDLAEGTISENPLIISSVWHEAAHIENYIAMPNKLELVTAGISDSSYFYKNSSIKKLKNRELTKSQGYYIVSRSHHDFDNSSALSELGIAQNALYEVIPIERGGEIIKEFLVYRLNPKSETLLIGAMSDGEAQSGGIYLYNFNATDGTTSLKSASDATNPTFMTHANDGKNLWCVAETGKETASVVAFTQNDSTHSYSPISEQLCAGAFPCHILRGDGWIATANYGGGSVSTFRVQSNNKTSALSQLFDFNADKKGKAAHLHCLIPAPDNSKTVFATDLGKDSIYRFTASNAAEIAKGASIFKQIYPSVAVKRGSGPRHLTFAPNGDKAYLICELSGDVVCFDYANGNLTEFQTAKSDSVGGRGSADIHISSDGRFLYTSNRLKADGISTFKINQNDGTIEKIDYTLTGKHPRNFALSSDENYLLVAVRDGNAVQIYRRDKNTGLLEYMGENYDIKLKKPMFVNFL